MEILTSYGDCLDRCMESKAFAIAHLQGGAARLGMCLSDAYEFHLIVSGSGRVLIDRRLYSARLGDVFLVNPYEIHRSTTETGPEEREYMIAIHPDYVDALPDDGLLKRCFAHRTAEMANKIVLSGAELERVVGLIRKIADLDRPEDVLERNGLFDEALDLFRTIFVRGAHDKRTTAGRERLEGYDIQVDAMLNHIHRHLSEPLGATDIAHLMFLSPSYVCRVFKEATGTTLNSYVSAKRAATAKRMLSEGRGLDETRTACGFSSTEEFERAFSKSVGVSPATYEASLAE